MNALVKAQAPQLGLVPSTMREAMDLATMMSKAGLLPTSFRNNPANCLLVIQQAVRWQADPFAVMQECSVIKEKIMYSGKLVAAIVNARANLTRRLSYDYSGEGTERFVTVSGTYEGETEPRTIVLKWKDAKTDNAMWTKQPDQQLMYAGSRVWARRHAPELMLGIYSPEEFDELPRRNDPPDPPLIEHHELPDDATPPEWRPKWHSTPLENQAGILCADPSFWTFLTERDEGDGEVIDTEGRATLLIHRLCGVKSRKEILPGTPAATMWHGLVVDYRNWQRDPELSSQVTASASAPQAPSNHPQPQGADAITDAAALMHEWDAGLAEAAELGSQALFAKWAQVPPGIQRLLVNAKDRRHKPRAKEVDVANSQQEQVS